jgi:hypothetical protein
VCVRDRRGHDHAIASFDDPRQARWVERLLEHHLGIIDCPLPGELPRGDA